MHNCIRPPCNLSQNCGKGRDTRTAYQCTNTLKATKALHTASTQPESDSSPPGPCARRSEGCSSHAVHMAAVVRGGPWLPRHQAGCV